MTAGDVHEDLVKFGHVVFELCVSARTRQTYLSQYFAPLLGAN